MNTNWNCIGHQNVISYLRRSIMNGLRTHAFLFIGPEHVGKLTLARIFAQTVLCFDATRSDQSPCGACTSCRVFASGAHPDVYTVTRAEDKKQISIEQIRGAQERMATSSLLNSYKVLIIESAHELSESASNALLKLLEEPHRKTIIILTSPDASLLLPTIVSRTQRIRCNLVPGKEIYAALVSRGMHRDDAATLSALACGRPGIALAYLADTEQYAAYRDRLRVLCHAIAGTGVDKIIAVDHLIPKGADGGEVLETLALVLREVLRAHVEGIGAIPHSFLEEPLHKVMLAHPLNSIVRAMKYVERAKELRDANVSPRTALEYALFHIY